MKPFEPTNCCECGAVLTEDEIKEFWSGPRCCNGYMCGCRGLPIDPPYCFKCIGPEWEGEGMTETTLKEAMNLQKSIDYHKKRLEELRRLYASSDAIQIAQHNCSASSVVYGDRMLKHEILNFVLNIEEAALERREKEFEAL